MINNADYQNSQKYCGRFCKQRNKMVCVFISMHEGSKREETISQKLPTYTIKHKTPPRSPEYFHIISCIEYLKQFGKWQNCCIRPSRVIHQRSIWNKYCKFDPSVNRKRPKILRSRLAMQNLTKLVYPFWLGKQGKFQFFFFLQARNQSINQSDRQSNNFFRLVYHKYRNMLSIWSSKHVVSCTYVPFGLQHLNLIFSHIFPKIRENQSKNRQFQAKMVKHDS